MRTLKYPTHANIYDTISAIGKLDFYRKENVILDPNYYYEDEISLKELILMLIANWKMIVACTVIALLLSAIYVFAIADEVYESSLTGNINIPESVDTAYGVYNFPTTNKMDYLNLLYSAPVLEKTMGELQIEESKRSFKDSIKLETEKDSTSFKIKMTGRSPEDAVNRITVLVNNYREVLHNTYKERAIAYFIKDYNTQVKLMKESLEAKREELEDLAAIAEDIPPVITVQKLLIDDPAYAGLLAREQGVSIGDLTGDKMLAEEPNPNYIKIQEYILDTRKAILETEQAMDRATLAIEKLNAEYVAIHQYQETGDRTGLDDSMLMVMESRVYLMEDPSYPLNPIAPKKSLTLAIALLLGLMLGVFIAFFKEYWKNDTRHPVPVNDKVEQS